MSWENLTLCKDLSISLSMMIKGTRNNIHLFTRKTKKATVKNSGRKTFVMSETRIHTSLFPFLFNRLTGPLLKKYINKYFIHTNHIPAKHVVYISWSLLLPFQPCFLESSSLLFFIFTFENRLFVNSDKHKNESH